MHTQSSESHQEGKIDDAESSAPVDIFRLYAPRTFPKDPDRHLSFGEIRLKYEEKLYKLIWNRLQNEEDTEELVADTFFSAYKAFSNFRGECKIQSWLWTIALNKCKNKYRQRKRTREKDVVSLDNLVYGESKCRLITMLVDSRPGPEESVLGETTYDIILNQIQKLPENYKTVIVLCDLEERSYQDIAAITGLSLQSIKTRIHRGRLLLRKRLTALLEEG